jgi:hypothetical protein
LATYQGLIIVLPLSKGVLQFNTHVPALYYQNSRELGIPSVLPYKRLVFSELMLSIVPIGMSEGWGAREELSRDSQIQYNLSAS